MGDFLALFDQETGRLKNAAEVAGEAEIFPPFPTRNDFSGKSQDTENNDFSTFSTFPTAEQDVHVGVENRTSTDASGGSRPATPTPPFLERGARVRSYSGWGSGKAGKPAISISISGKEWEKWERLAPSASDLDDVRAAFDERAGVLEFDCGLSRAEAETKAYGEVKGAEALRVRKPATAGGRTPGVIIRAPARELAAADYDARLDTLINAAGDDAVARDRLILAKRKGWVVPCGDETIFTRGRT